MTQALGSADGVDRHGPPEDRYGEVLTDRALALIAQLHRSFDARRRQLLDARQERYAQLAAGGTLGFLHETKDIREDPSWRVADARARAWSTGGWRSPARPTAR